MAISTGMRRAEILTLTWTDIDFERQRIILRITKNGEVRVLPLVGLAYKLLKDLKENQHHATALLFPGKDLQKPFDFCSPLIVAITNSRLDNF